MSFLYDKSFLRSKAERYCELNETSITQELGFGTQGVVYQTSKVSAIKVHNLEIGYKRERDIYARLKERDIQSIRGFMIPRIINWDDAIWIFEMSIVHVPCILDFGGAYLNEAPAHMNRDEYWEQQLSEDFGENWSEAKAVLREIEYAADIYIADVNTGNIKFLE